jgi:hypothetical protein
MARSIILALSLVASTTASAQELAGELQHLEAQGGPDLSGGGWLMIAGGVVGIGGGVLLRASLPQVFACWPTVFSVRRCDDGEAEYHAGIALAAVGGAALIAGIIWLAVVVQPYRADDPRRDRIGAIRDEQRRRERLSVLPAIDVLESGAIVRATGTFCSRDARGPTT